MFNPKEVLVSTLGVQPQVVTIALDLLLERGCQIEEVIVVHTSRDVPAIGNAITMIKRHAGEYDQKFKFVPIQNEDETPISDVSSEREVRAVFRTIFRVIQEQKRSGNRVHLCIAGGRKVMSAYGVVAAQVLFDGNDRLWHLISQESWMSSQRMHADDRYTTLVPIPVLMWSAISPALTQMTLYSDPWMAIEHQNRITAERSVQWKRRFVESDLTDAERKLLEMLVTEGLTNKELASRLHRSQKTIANQLSQIYEKFRNCPEVEGEVIVNRTTLIMEFSDYYARVRKSGINT